MKDQEDRVPTPAGLMRPTGDERQDRRNQRLALILSEESGPTNFGRFSVSCGPYVSVAEQLYMPEWMTISGPGYGEPNLLVRIELRKSAPRVVYVSFDAAQDSREIRSSDLRAIDFQEYLDVYKDFVSMMEVSIRAITNLLQKDAIYEYAFYEAVYGEQTDDAVRALPGIDYEGLKKLVEGNVEQQRRGGNRLINGAFLKEVAAVYRQNIDHAPTAAVARTFGVKHRQATDYVKQARDRGLLPPTQQGKAKA